MTVIAWDGHTLAADQRATCGGGIARTVTKIQRFDDELLAMTGDWDVCVELREWYKTGRDPERFPIAAREANGSLIVFGAGGSIRTYQSAPHPMPIEQDKCAFGSGRDFAEAAMYLGFDARRGVEVACAMQTDCGNGIDTLTLDAE